MAELFSLSFMYVVILVFNSNSAVLLFTDNEFYVFRLVIERLPVLEQQPAVLEVPGVPERDHA